MKIDRHLSSLVTVLACAGLLIVAVMTRAADAEKLAHSVSNTVSSKPLAAVLTPEKWQQIEKAIDRALSWIATQQAADGSFATLPAGQPAVTSLSVMAFLS